MKEEKRYKGMQSFGIGVLLLGATAVLSLLRSSTLMMTVTCAAAAVGEFLMAFGAMTAAQYNRSFRKGSIFLLVAALFRTVGPALHLLEVAGTSETMAVLEGGAAALATILDAVGVAAVMRGCIKVGREREAGRGLAVTALGVYPPVAVIGQAVPIILAVWFGGERTLVLGGITIAAILVFLAAYLAAAASQNAFRKVAVEYEQQPGTRKHVKRPEQGSSRKRGKH